MLSGRTFGGKKLPLTVAFAVLVAAAFGAGCSGFFQKNTLSSIAIQPPTPTIQVDNTQTLQAWGTYQDNSRSQITSGVAWSSSAPDVLTIDPSSGVAKGVSVGPSTITASAQGLSATASATVFIVINNLTVTPTTWTFVGANGGTSPGFTVTAATTGGNVDVTSTATFTPSNTTFINCATGTSPVVCTASNGTTPGFYTITVGYPQSNITATIRVTAS